MKPTNIIGMDPKIIKYRTFFLLYKFNKSFLKYTIIANKDPKCMLISSSNDE